MADGTVALKDANGNLVLLDNEQLIVAGNTVERQRITIGALAGTWAYYAGTSGTVNVAAGQRVLGIAAHSTAGGSMTIAGGASIPIPANVGISVSPQGNLVAPTVVLTGTDSYFIEVVS